ncbi:MAG: preprotein translocase subunit SecE [Nitrospirota bacterium]
MFDKIKNFFKDVKIELKKVVFPDREAVIGSTKVVIITVIIMSLFLGLVDISLAKLVSLSLR